MSEIPKRGAEKDYQPELFSISPLVHVYHDEVKAERKRNPFLGHGLLFVPDSYRDPLLKELSDARSDVGYSSEVHYTEIKGARGNPAFSVASQWLDRYFKRAMHHCAFKAFIIEDGPNGTFPYPG